MEYFPIFLRLAGEPVLVVGGGDVAARKVDLLLRARADVTVVAPRLGERLTRLAARGAVAHVAREFEPGHLAGMRLAFAATDRPAVNAWVAHQAESRGIDVNVVDDRELSRFIMPAIVDRDPVVVAVSSAGDAPVLTRRLREQLERFLPQRLGLLARIAGRLRGQVRQRIQDAGARRRFWERFFDGEVGEDVLAGRMDEQQAAAACATLVARAARSKDGAVPAAGSVTLVGAGPGDPGLLTLRALRVLQDADVVLHDRLVSPAILDLARRDAMLIDVGKRAGDAWTQDSINARLVSLAQSGRRVVRLKGGDPFVFGRGGEELEAVTAAGIRCEVVPGVTAALGCAAYAGIPLTHRDHAQSVILVTGQGSRDGSLSLDWATLAKPKQTVVIYMGLKPLPELVAQLMHAGAPADRPVALVAAGTLDRQQVIAGTLATIANDVAQAEIRSPGVLIVGDVAALGATLQWFAPQAPAPAAGPVSAGRIPA